MVVGWGGVKKWRVMLGKHGEEIVGCEVWVAVEGVEGLGREGRWGGCG